MSEETKVATKRDGVETITLDTPLKRGGKEVAEITVRKPTAGELRGLALTDVLQMDVNTLTKLLPRITQPTLHADEIKSMDPADLLQLGGAAAGFLLTREQRG